MFSTTTRYSWQETTQISRIVLQIDFDNLYDLLIFMNKSSIIIDTPAKLKKASLRHQSLEILRDSLMTKIKSLQLKLKLKPD